MRKFTTIEGLILQKEGLLTKIDRNPKQINLEISIINEKIQIEIEKNIIEARKFAQFLIKTSK